MSAPPVTIGLPVYNGENYVDEAIRSLLTQTFPDFRLVIADNASSDATEEICRAFASDDPRIDYHRHERNLGAAPNYNFCVAVTESPYFMWHAHDDVRAPGFLEKALQGFEATPGASVVFSIMQRIGPIGEEGDILPRPPELTSPFAHRRLRAAITSTLGEGAVLFGLMDRGKLARTGGHGAFKGGDRLLIAELATLGPFVEVAEPLFFNREHPARYVRMKDGDAKRRWWDTSESRVVSLPRWKGLFGYLAAVGRSSEMSLAGKIQGLGAVAASLFDNRMYLSKQLVGDLVSVGPALIGAARTRSSGG